METTESSLDGHVYDLLIVGAGPVGMLCALGAHARGCRNIAVIDQTRGFRRAGELLDLQPNGLRALRYLAPAVAAGVLQLKSMEGSSFPILDAGGNQIQAGIRGSASGDPVVPINWSVLQEKMVDALPKDIMLSLNLRLEDLEYADAGGEQVVRADCIQDRVRANPFRNWGDGAPGEAARAGGAHQPKKRSLLARFVIGADGIHSVCRAVVYRNIGGAAWGRCAKPEYAGFVSFKGKGELPEAEVHKGNALVDFMQGQRYGMVYPRVDDFTLTAPRVMFTKVSEETRPNFDWGWLFLVHLSVEEDLGRLAPEAGGASGLLKRAISELEQYNFPKCMVDLAEVLLAESSPLHKILSRPLYVVPIDHPPPFERRPTAKSPTYPDGFYRPFGCDRIALAGDSLHGMPPTMAQGTSMGFEDACELIDSLSEACGWESGDATFPGVDSRLDILTKYRNGRLERLRFVQRTTMNPPDGGNTEENDRTRRTLMDFDRY